ncbi:prolyl 4-hydroxylase subunit alpha-1-like [Mytilus edulis]|uniref:prolyl 4-hydroxylase subunit alpha-1-like n=1 Tax=Mytilus edulis TaxID=6550 RepID=UPI0039EEDBBF
MKANLVFFLFLFDLEIRHVFTDFYSSIETLTQLSQNELKLVSALRRFIVTQEKQEEDVDKFLKQFLRSTEGTVSEKGIDNPIDAFHLLRRWVEDWQKCFDIVICPDCDMNGPHIDFNLTRGIVEKRIGGWPQKTDLDAAVSAIFRLWNFYQFDLHKFLHGKIFEFETEPFTPADVIYIANKAEEFNNMYNSIQFLETLLDELKKGKFPNSHVTPTTLSRIIAAAYNRYDMPGKSVEILKECTKAEPGNKRLHNDYDYFKTRAASISKLENVTAFDKAEAEDNMTRDYENLCRGSLKSPKELSRLFCYYKATDDPFYFVKTELANLQPRIFLFHDIISDDEIVFLRNISEKQLSRSTTMTKQGMIGSEDRISHTAWLSDLDFLELKKLTLRVKLITGLETEFRTRYSNTEEYQILNYGVGGMYKPHVDPLSDRSIFPGECRGSGDRIATIMFYLSHVMYGGATVFPNIKTRIPVQKGSAAFWYNLELNGEIDQRMLHAGCPVLVGSKWVSNKWIRERGQMFKRPCGLKKKSKERRL